MCAKTTEGSRDLSIISPPKKCSQKSVNAYKTGMGASGTYGSTSQRSHKLLCKSYTVPSLLRFAPSSSTWKGARVQCHVFSHEPCRPSSFDKVYSTKRTSGTTTHRGCCLCPASRSGVCSHSITALELLLLLKENNYKDPPPEMSCTELPQQ
ncbi:unnamed protein product [Ixodes persulcatus]